MVGVSCRHAAGELCTLHVAYYTAWKFLKTCALLGIGRGRQSARPSTIPAVLLIGHTQSIVPLALLTWWSHGCPMEDFSTTSSSATQPAHLKACANRRRWSHYGLRCDFLTCRSKYLCVFRVRTGRGLLTRPLWDSHYNGPSATIDLGRDAIIMGLMISAPALLVGMAVGLLIGLLQALTQIQDQTVAFVPKIVAMVAALHSACHGCSSV